jgi:hypothetical protein
LKSDEAEVVRSRSRTISYLERPLLGFDSVAAHHSCQKHLARFPDFTLGR